MHLKKNSLPVTEFDFDWVSELTKLSQYWSCCPEQYTELSHPDHRKENIEFDINHSDDNVRPEPHYHREGHCPTILQSVTIFFVGLITIKLPVAFPKMVIELIVDC